MARLTDPERQKHPAGILSNREYQVMIRLAQGKTNREIAKELGISVKTIDTHRGHVLDKLKLMNNSDVTWFAMTNRYVDEQRAELDEPQRAARLVLDQQFADFAARQAREQGPPQGSHRPTA